MGLLYAGLVALELGACAPDMTPVTRVEDLRVLAVQAEPPEVAPGDNFNFSALVTDPYGDGRALDWVMTLCTLDPLTGACLEYDEIASRYSGSTQEKATKNKATQNKATQNKATQSQTTQDKATQDKATQDKATQNAHPATYPAAGAPLEAFQCQEAGCQVACLQMCGSDCSEEEYIQCCIGCEYLSCCVRFDTSTPVDGILEIDGGTYPPLRASESLLEGMDASDAYEGTNAQLTFLVCESGVCISELDDSSTSLSLESLATSLPPDQSTMATKQIRISSAPSDEQNQNPIVSAIEIDDQSYGYGDTVPVSYGQTYTLTPVLADGSIEAYTYQLSDGTIDDRCESPYFSWYATDGEFEEYYSEPENDGVCPPGPDALQATSDLWTAPNEEDALDTEVTVFTVVRDRRGGMDWLYVTLELE